MYQENQIFEETYPPEAAEWCNESDKYHIEEIEPDGETKRFQIVANATWIPTVEEQIAFLKASLESTDYISAKMNDEIVNCGSITDLLAVAASFKGKYGDVIKQRQEWRDKINELQEQEV